MRTQVGVMSYAYIITVLQKWLMYYKEIYSKMVQTNQNEILKYVQVTYRKARERQQRNEIQRKQS